jgi:hypothetical protein
MIYTLYNDNRKILSLTLNPFSNSARIELDKEKRVFLIRKEGFRRKKLVLRNEYGIKIGELGHENKQDFIDLNNDRFYYTFHNAPMSELVLYKGSKDAPVISCSLDTTDGNPSIEFNKTRTSETFSHTGLLVALCWYMFLPIAKENITDPVTVPSS